MIPAKYQPKPTGGTNFESVEKQRSTIRADEGEPTEADVRVNRVIDELKCFDVSPRELNFKLFHEQPLEAVRHVDVCVHEL